MNKIKNMSVKHSLYLAAFIIKIFIFSTICNGTENIKIVESLKDIPVFNKSVFEKLYFVDEWAYSPHANQKKFILLHLADTTMKIYDNKELHGNPVFFISASKFFPFDSNLPKDSNSGLSPNTCFNSGLQSNKRIET